MPKCKACKKAFTPFNSMQKACGPKCALKLVELQKKEKKKLFSSESVEKARKQLKKLSDNDRPTALRKAQKAFNAYIRKRDEGNACISCQEFRNETAKGKGSNFHAGHYKTAGGFPELRFNEDNCHLQCAHCNSFLSGNISMYRPNLINKIGLRAVKKLESQVKLPKYTLDEIKEIEQEYKRKLKELN